MPKLLRRRRLRCRLIGLCSSSPVSPPLALSLRCGQAPEPIWSHRIGAPLKLVYLLAPLMQSQKKFNHFRHCLALFEFLNLRLKGSLQRARHFKHWIKVFRQ
jgi:hypothetical protein